MTGVGLLDYMSADIAADLPVTDRATIFNL